MLHDQKGEFTLPLPDDDSKFSTANGEVRSFDGPDNTCCVLKDPETCHFHNQDDFEEVVRRNQGSFTIINRSDDPGRLKIYKPTDGYLYDKSKSCVRQLLDENITPFPYKVAKALDPSIYRNTEFEFWQELRKECRLKWHDVEGSEKFFVQCPPFAQTLDESAYMALDDDVKKKYIYVNSKEDEYGSKKFGFLTGFDNFRPSRDALEAIVMPMHHHNYRSWRGPRRSYNNRHHNINYSNDDREFQYIEQETVYTPSAPPVFQDGYQYVYADPGSPPPFYQPMHPQIVQYIPQTPYPQHPAPYNQQPVTYPNFSIPPPSIMSYPPPATAGNNPAAQREGDHYNLIRDNELASTNINWNPKESVDENDLPMNDVSSLQFFYNLGVRYFFAAGVQRKLENVANHFDSLNIQDGQGDKNEPPPVPTNTPVTTKANSFGPPGNRSHHSNNQYNYRRAPFSSQHSRNDRDHGNQNQKENNKGRSHYNNNNGGFSRKEIQFNSNVKNVHKAETSFQKHNNGQSSTQNGGAQEKNNTLTISSVSSSVSPTSSAAENSNSSNEQPAQTQNTLPPLTIPPPQVQMTYAVS
jgi:hypothetical protein